MGWPQGQGKCIDTHLFFQGLNALLRIYKRHLPTWGGYLTDAGEVHLEHLECVLTEIGKIETGMFVRRATDAEAVRFFSHTHHSVCTRTGKIGLWSLVRRATVVLACLRA